MPTTSAASFYFASFVKHGRLPREDSVGNKRSARRYAERATWTFCLARSLETMRFERVLTAFLVLLPLPLAWPQTPAPADDPRVAFAPLTLPDPVNAYRSSNGAPGFVFFKQKTAYEMHAVLDTSAKILQN